MYMYGMHCISCNMILNFFLHLWNSEDSLWKIQREFAYFNILEVDAVCVQPLPIFLGEGCCTQATCTNKWQSLIKKTGSNMRKSFSSSRQLKVC